MPPPAKVVIDLRPYQFFIIHYNQVAHTEAVGVKDCQLIPQTLFCNSTIP